MLTDKLDQVSDFWSFLQGSSSDLDDEAGYSDRFRRGFRQHIQANSMRIHHTWSSPQKFKTLKKHFIYGDAHNCL